MSRHVAAQPPTGSHRPLAIQRDGIALVSFDSTLTSGERGRW
jgi:hypothetical protein